MGQPTLRGDLDVGVVGGGQRVLRWLTLAKARGIDPTVSVSGANAGDVTASIPGAGRARSSHRVMVELVAPMTAGPLDATVTLRWDGGEAKAALEGEVALFDLEASEAYGTVDVGDLRAGAIVVTNRCFAPLDVTITPPSAPFTSVGGTSATLPARGALAIAIDYAPTAVGAHQGTLSVAGGGVTKTASLSGTGRQPDDPFSEAAQVGEPGGTEVVPGGGSTATGEYQRLYLHVPTKNTNVSLGKEYDGAQHDPTHAGFSATTEGHLLLRNRVEAMTMTLQSKGQGWFQSTTKNVYLGAGDGGMAMIAEGGAYLSSGKGVVLAAGHGDVGTMNEFDSGASPPVPTVAAIGDAMNDVALGWSIANLLMGGIGIAYGAARISVALKNFRKNKKYQDKTSGFLAVPIAGLIKTAVMTGTAMHDLINKEEELGRDPVLPSQSINMFGQGGALFGTPAYCSIYGLTGVTFRSANAGVLGLVNATIDSLVASGMYGYMSAGMSSIQGVSISANKKVVVGSPGGSLDVKAPAIEMTSETSVELRGDTGLNVGAPQITAKATTFAAQGDQVQVNAVAVTRFAVADTYAIEIGPDGVKIGSLLGPALDPTKPSVLIGAQGVSLVGGPPGTTGLTVSPAGVMLDAPGNSLWNMGPMMLSLLTRWELA